MVIDDVNGVQILGEDRNDDGEVRMGNHDGDNSISTLEVILRSTNLNLLSLSSSSLVV